MYSAWFELRVLYTHCFMVLQCWDIRSDEHRPTAYSSQVPLHIQPQRSLQVHPGSVCQQNTSTQCNFLYIIAGVLQADPGVIREHNQIFRLFCHEAQRVFHDRLINKEDKTYFYGMLSEMSSKHFSKVHCIRGRLFDVYMIIHTYVRTYVSVKTECVVWMCVGCECGEVWVESNYLWRLHQDGGWPLWSSLWRTGRYEEDPKRLEWGTYTYSACLRNYIIAAVKVIIIFLLCSTLMISTWAPLRKWNWCSLWMPCSMCQGNSICTYIPIASTTYVGSRERRRSYLYE